MKYTKIIIVNMLFVSAVGRHTKYFATKTQL